MENRYSEHDAEQAVARYARLGIGRDLALRVYTTRLLGSVPQLVLHGGGNTSVKTTIPDANGDATDVLCVKGSGWDMATIEPAGLPAVRLDPLRRLLEREGLTDEEMVRLQRANLIDPAAPNPSVEALLHAFLPHRFIDHTHANAVLALTDQPDGEAICREVFGDTLAPVPYIMPGFALAKAAWAAWQASPDVEGLILHKHGIFTFGETAREAYERMIDKISRAEQYFSRTARATRVALPPRTLPPAVATLAEVAPIIRGATAIGDGDGEPQRWIATFRTSPAIREFVDGADLASYAVRGTATPDYVIRIKPKPLIVPPPEAGRLDAFAGGVRAAVAAYHEDYRAYFARHNANQSPTKTMLDPAPRVVLVPGLGLFGIGANAKAAAIAADLAETNLDIVTAAERMSRFEAIAESDIFDMEYWSLEQAKLGRARELPMARQVVLITGAASGIGAACAVAFREQGAEVAVLDRDESGATAIAKKVGGLALVADVTQPEQVRAAFERIAHVYGGIDVVVSNAGAAWQGRIGDVADETLRQSFELNFWSHQTIAQHAVRMFLAQGTGGCLLFNASKQALNPGPDFGPYGLPKAALLALMRQYALEYGHAGIRASAVNADRIRSGLLTEEMIAARARARGVTPETYMAGNLLAREVTADDVAHAFVSLARARGTTAAVLTVDGGNIAAAVR